MLFEFPRETAVVCHDAGAANIVIAELQTTGRSDWRACMRGPALPIWKAAFPNSGLFDTIEGALLKASLLLTGTGWATSMEHDARRLAKERGIRSIAVVDHWVSYPERFARDGNAVWPDEIWVTDDYAMDIARCAFPEMELRKRPNRYVERQLGEIEQVEQSSPPELLYVLEPIREDWGRTPPGEFQALDYFVENLDRLDLGKDAVIRLRPHPSDAPGKYADWISDHASLNICLDSAIGIARSLGRSRWVAGCESFALVLALEAGRTTYCTLPPWAPACRLPHKGLVQLRNLT